ncbi:hypothetical protein ACFL2Q_17045 [Thermodesulfobacteriota bacterium]
MDSERRLHIPGNVPEEFAQAVATILLLGVAGGEVWDRIYLYPPDVSLDWIDGILRSNEAAGLVRPDIVWWEHQVRGH